VTDANKIGIIIFGTLFITCCLLVWWDARRPRGNRRYRLPPPFKDDRDSINRFRKMYGGKP
jgi:hypothetical protein